MTARRNARSPACRCPMVSTSTPRATSTSPTASVPSASTPLAPAAPPHRSRPSPVPRPASPDRAASPSRRRSCCARAARRRARRPVLSRPAARQPRDHPVPVEADHGQPAERAAPAQRRDAVGQASQAGGLPVHRSRQRPLTPHDDRHPAPGARRPQLIDRSTREPALPGRGPSAHGVHRRCVGCSARSFS